MNWMPRPDTIRVGLRFERRDARTLRELARRVQLGDLKGHALTTFTQAAAAAETGEPLQVVCRDRTEAALMAHGYSLWGISQPVIETLN